MDAFLNLYEAVESELIVTLPESYRVCAALTKLRKPLYNSVVNKGGRVPTTWREFKSAAKRAEATEARETITPPRPFRNLSRRDPSTPTITPNIAPIGVTPLADGKQNTSPPPPMAPIPK